MTEHQPPYSTLVIV